MAKPFRKGLSEERDVEVITTHVNADYDALASMLAAAKLYPGAVLVLSGAQERNLRNFFVETTCYFFNFAKVKDIPFERVGRLILVDTRQIDRIGPLAELAQDPYVEIIAYDHHPDSDTDVVADLQLVKPVGATVTLLSRILRENRVELSRDEATLLALGIYEDTGSFTFPSTTTEDFEAAAWLLEQGANLSTISSLITRELTAEEVGLLHDLISSAHKLEIGGVEITVSEVSRERYVPEFAVLVHRFMDMENLDAFFALARMEGRIYLVARSRVPEVDAGRVAAAFGGGGHASAASATIRGMTLLEARDKLLAVLHSQVNPTRTAADIMTGPVIHLSPATSLEQAHDTMNRYGLNILPVVEDHQVLGIITSDIVERALHHGLGELAVSEYMDREVETLEADAPLTQVEELLVSGHQLVVPVTREGHLVGVITRDDYLEALSDEPLPRKSQFNPAASGHQVRRKNIESLMRERLPREVVEILKDLGERGSQGGHRLYLVGGSVRDLFLRHENLDLDIVVEGDAMAFARDYAAGRDDLKIRTHHKFNTAKLIFADGLSIDLATARLEYYQSPAALPEVELSSLKLDLYRRDFTINTLAVCLAPHQFGRLLDFFDGLRDLKSKVIRVLHNLSFVEDPTRIFRAVRFEQRFGFRIGKFTEALIKNALKIEALKNLSGTRLFNEFRLMMEEERALDCLRRLESLRLLEFFHPKLRLDAAREKLLEGVNEALAWYRLSFLDQPVRSWLVYLLALADPLKEADLKELCQRLALAPKLRREMAEMRRRALKALNHMDRGPLKSSEVYRLLQDLRPAYLLFIMAKAKRDYTKKAVSLFLSAMSQVRPLLGGDDLRELGFLPGPLYGRILERLLEARLDGEVATRQDELALVEREFGHLRPKEQ